MPDPIPSSEISVVMQGPLVSETIAHAVPLTQRCLESVRRWLPGSEIVLSTWEGSNVDGLDYDRVVFSKDPGLTASHAAKGQNLNRQIKSTQAGMQAASRSYMLKTRTDVELTGAGFAEYFGRYPKRGSKILLEERVVAWSWLTKTPARSPEGCLFHLSDMVHFGRRQDVMALWSAPMFIRDEAALKVDEQVFQDAASPTVPESYYVPEQYLCISWLRKHRQYVLRKKPSPDEIADAEKILVDNFIILDPSQFSGRWKDSVRINRSVWAQIYSHAEWEKLYRKHCDPSFSASVDMEWPLKCSIQIAQRRLGGLVRLYSALYHRLAMDSTGAPKTWREVLRRRLFGR